MKYSIVFTKSSAKDISKLSQPVQKRIKRKLEFYLDSPTPFDQAKTLTNSKYGDYRWRVGDYRIIFDVDNDQIVILQVQHRRDIYKNL